MNSALLKTLSDANLISGDIPKNEALESPWIIKILLGFSGWLAAVFTLGFFVAIFSSLSIRNPPLILIGLSLVALAFFILIRKPNDFFENLALAISLAGQAMFFVGLINYFGSFRHFENLTIIWAIFAVLQVLLALFIPSFIHRVFSAFLGAIGFASALYLYQNSLTLPSLYGAFLMLLTALVWLNEFKFPTLIEKFQAVGYGLVLALIALKGTNLFMDSHFWRHSASSPIEHSWLQPWMSETLLSAVMVYVVWKLLQKSQPKPTHKTQILALIGTLFLSLLSLQAQGITVGVMIMLLGFSASNRVLMGLGILSLLFYISSYYYLLEITLLNKSLTLLALGIGLIVARWIMLTMGEKQGVKS